MKFLFLIKEWLSGLFCRNGCKKRDPKNHHSPLVESPDIPLTALDVVNDYISFPYCGVELTLRKEEKEKFDKLSREERRKMAHRFKNAVKKGRIKLIKTGGKTIAVINKNYGTSDKGNKKDTYPGEQCFNKTRQITR